jgi:hypothetical protein
MGTTTAGRALLALVVACSCLLCVGLASASPAAKPRVTAIGDSISESLEYVPSARRYLGRGLDLRIDTAVCRRLVYEGCAFQGTTPSTALEVVRERGRGLGRVVVVNVGYNDWTGVYDAARMMRGLRAAGVRTVVWVTLRETTSNYARTNAVIRRAGRRWKDVVVADWAEYSRGRAWFREDGLHLNPDGATGLARLLRPLVLDGLAGS